MKRLIEELKYIGLTEYEARAYITLLENGNLTGYEVAKRSGIPKPNTYSALNALVEKGFAYKLQGSTTLLKARDFKEISFNLINQLEDRLNYIENNLPKRISCKNSFINIEGNEKILDKAYHMIKQAKKKIYLDAWEEEVEYLYDIIALAQKRGVKVIIIVMGNINSVKKDTLNNIYIHSMDDDWQNHGHRDLNLICDDIEALSGEVGKKESQAIFSNNASFVSLATDAFTHDIYLEEVKKLTSNETMEKLKEIEENILTD